MKSENIVRTTFELKKKLATPSLKCGVAFHKRQLWAHSITNYEIRKIP
jgi:hypothetical protein